MYELVKINDNDYYIDCPSKIGLIKTDSTNVILIDSGNDKDTAKKILKIIEENNWHLLSIYNTHSHADHIGGNKYLQEKTNCKIYSYSIENIYVNNPILEPVTLFGGLPFNEIENKFLKAQSSTSTSIKNNDLPYDIKLLELPGHSYNMVGFLTKDGTAYIGDSISSKETLSKYGICYLWNFRDSLNTLETLKTINAEIYVPSHADVSRDITSLIEVNINAIRAVEETILNMLAEPLSFETLLKMLFDNYSLQLNIQQYVLIGSTLRSYLSIMYTEKKIKYLVVDNYLYWIRN